MGDNSHHRVSLSLVIQSVVLDQSPQSFLEMQDPRPSPRPADLNSGLLQAREWSESDAFCIITHAHTSHMECEVVLGQPEPFSTLDLWYLEQGQIYSLSALICLVNE